MNALLWLGEPGAEFVERLGQDVVIRPQPGPLGIDDPSLAELLEMMRQRRLRDVKQRHQLSHAHLAGMLAEDIDELQPDRITKRLGDLGQPGRLLAIDVRVEHRLTTRITLGSLDLRSQL